MAVVTGEFLHFLAVFVFGDGPGKGSAFAVDDDAFAEAGVDVHGLSAFGHG